MERGTLTHHMSEKKNDDLNMFYKLNKNTRPPRALRAITGFEEIEARKIKDEGIKVSIGESSLNNILGKKEMVDPETGTTRRITFADVNKAINDLNKQGSINSKQMKRLLDVTRYDINEGLDMIVAILDRIHDKKPVAPVFDGTKRDDDPKDDDDGKFAELDDGTPPREKLPFSIADLKTTEAEIGGVVGDWASPDEFVPHVRTVIAYLKRTVTRERNGAKVMLDTSTGNYNNLKTIRKKLNTGKYMLDITNLRIRKASKF
jgi:hypothetical protein